MKLVLLRVGIDTGSGGAHGPLFGDGSFEYLSIPDRSGPDGLGVDERTYGNTTGRSGRPFSDYLPPRLVRRMRDQPMHLDPEFVTCTYGDPARLKGGLQRLRAGDLLVFYCGLRGWDVASEPALYLMGYFEVLAAGMAASFTPLELHDLFQANFHVRHPSVFARDRDRLVLVKGGSGSRLLRRAVPISEVGRNRSGGTLHILSRPMQSIFGSFGGKLSIQRSPPRWVSPDHVERAAEFVRSCD